MKTLGNRSNIDTTQWVNIVSSGDAPVCAPVALLQLVAIASYYVSSCLVLCSGNFNGFRAKQMIQDKAQFAENGESFSRTATRYWIICLAPFGRAGKRSSALLRLLERASYSLQGALSGQPFHDSLSPLKLPEQSTATGAQSGTSPGLQLRILG